MNTIDMDSIIDTMPRLRIFTGLIRKELERGLNEASKQTLTRVGKEMEKVHSFLHEASHEITKGNIEQAQILLSQADQIAHDLC